MSVIFLEIGGNTKVYIEKSIYFIAYKVSSSSYRHHVMIEVLRDYLKDFGEIRFFNFDVKDSIRGKHNLLISLESKETLDEKRKQIIEQIWRAFIDNYDRPNPYYSPSHEGPKFLWTELVAVKKVGSLAEYKDSAGK